MIRLREPGGERDLWSDLNIFKSYRNRVTYLLNQARQAFYTNFIDENSTDHKRLFRATKQLLAKKEDSHITPVQCSLHWLPVKFRIDFKIHVLLLTFKAIYGHAPGYLIDLIAIKEQPRYNLRSASGLILKYPSLKLKKTLGDRAFHLQPLIYGTICPFTSVLRM